jgi:uncharacterized protein (DUF952 family)
MGILLHIATKEDWLAGQTSGVYRVVSLEKEGFIHCSTVGQLMGVANDYYAGRQGLLLLVIDDEKVPAEIRYEDCYETGQQFPHIYGPLPANAIVEAIDFLPSEDGTFSLPAGLA